MQAAAKTKNISPIFHEAQIESGLRLFFDLIGESLFKGSICLLSVLSCQTGIQRTDIRTAGNRNGKTRLSLIH